MQDLGQLVLGLLFALVKVEFLGVGDATLVHLCSLMVGLLQATARKRRLGIDLRGQLLICASIPCRRLEVDGLRFEGQLRYWLHRRVPSSPRNFLEPIRLFETKFNQMNAGRVLLLRSAAHGLAGAWHHLMVVLRRQAQEATACRGHHWRLPGSIWAWYALSPHLRAISLPCAFIVCLKDKLLLQPVGLFPVGVRHLLRLVLFQLLWRLPR